ncbi:hypothetical protein JUJ52_03740 [Virgibacillus sp. AGTR]|uniref:hypothetical protein n=1 Tax=unclassified Virgibacillus TaxID=2620237 RepID=UPI000EF53FAE|nr:MULTISPECIES: hypothetical protein [unclassified Virgibacillus]MCC2249071.1 hypothetical protein [Virgibacillus sp. AGTR]QRZ17576.1 hypothetical protein JUJ52_17685 [Virgibacillus sp. AGTR]
MVKIHFNIDENNRIRDGWSSTSTRNQNEIVLHVAEDHEVLTNAEVFKYENGELVKDVEYQQQLLKQQQEIDNKPSPDKVNAIATLELAETVAEMKGGN